MVNEQDKNTKVSSADFQNFEDEYKYFLEKYLFRLLGITGTKLISQKITWHKEHASVTKARNTVRFSAYNRSFFRLDVVPFPLDDDNISLANNIVKAFLSCSEYAALKPDLKRNHYRNTVARDKAYKLAIQDGICQWIFGVTNAEILAQFFDLLEKWSVKTYEGKHVTLGFLIDPSSNKNALLSFEELLTFLNDDSSAVLSDCIHSVLELDRNCNLIGYHSVTENLETLPSCELSEYIPIRFIQTVQQFIPLKTNESGSDKVGVFLLSNGDILLVKNGTTRFVKRNLQWLNLSEPAFINSLNSNEQYFPINDYVPSEMEKILRSVYASVLDVSFSHTGGIIAIIDPKYINDLMTSKILCPFDNLQISDEDATSLGESLQFPEQLEAKKVRRKLLKRLIQCDHFYTVDRKLRNELIALDGACIIDYNGTVYSFGAIIQNDSGSATGGRSSAAKKLSDYGIAIKISTDGYIDVYINSELVYSIK